MPASTPTPTMRRRVRRRFRTRPFFVSTALILALVAVHRLVPGLVGPAAPSSPLSPSSPLLVRRDGAADGGDERECRFVHEARDQCAFVLANCDDEQAGLLPYLTFYYCSMQHAQPVAFLMLVVWLGLLFTTIGIAASDFFSVNLGTIASILGLSESLAGVTFLAFGNGSPDVFSTFAAMSSNSGSMAVGELIGAASFITGVVAGSMALVREFKVGRRTFVRDICFFIVSVAFAMLFLADGSLVLWECSVMIGFYVFYVLTVVGWHWITTRRKQRRAREAALHGHFYGAAGADGADDLAPYHDATPAEAGGGDDGDDDMAEPDDSTPVGGRRARPPPDISALERGPRIAVESVDSPGERDPTFAHEAGDRVLSEEAQERRNRHITAEMTNSMRVHMPRGRRRATTATPIRPSLLGALEFRSVLASLQQSGTVRMNNIDRRNLGSGRRRTNDIDGGYPASALPYVSNGGLDRDLQRSPLLPEDPRGEELAAEAPFGFRDRALSSGDRPLGWNDNGRASPVPSYTGQAPPALVVPELLAPSGPSDSDDDQAVTSGSVSPEADATPIASPMLSPSTPATSRPQPRTPPMGLHLEIPTSPQYGGGVAPSVPSSSPALSPFPVYSESPMPFSPLPPAQVPNLPLTGRTAPLHCDDLSSFPGIDDNGDIPKPVRWWPYSVLPPPHVILHTLFPSLAGWREKTMWDRFVSLISAPTVFLLVLTLPVVEMELESDVDEDLDEEDLGDDIGDGGGGTGGSVYEPLITHGPNGAADGIETEWQRYRRCTNSPMARPPVLESLQAAAAAAPDNASSAAVSVHSQPSAIEEAAARGDDGDDGHETHLRYADENDMQGDEHMHEHTHEHTHDHGSHHSAYHSDDDGGREHVPAITTTLPDLVARPSAPTLPELSVSEAVSPCGWNRWLVAVQLVAGPLFMAFILWANMAEEMERPGRSLVRMLLIGLVASCVMLGTLLATTTAKSRPKYYSLLCFLGFVISVAWISTVAGEVVGLLKAFGVIVGISEAILGLTIFAVGNSLGDLVADITVARLGYPVMALSACFGGPMLNILLGVGIGGAWMTTKAAKDRESSHPGQPRTYEPYVIEVGGTLLVSAVTVLVTLVFLLVAVPANRWVMSRQIGLALISFWAVSTVINVILEVTGTWG